MVEIYLDLISIINLYTNEPMDKSLRIKKIMDKDDLIIYDIYDKLCYKQEFTRKMMFDIMNIKSSKKNVVYF